MLTILSDLFKPIYLIVSIYVVHSICYIFRTNLLWSTVSLLSKAWPMKSITSSFLVGVLKRPQCSPPEGFLLASITTWKSFFPEYTCFHYAATSAVGLPIQTQHLCRCHNGCFSCCHNHNQRISGEMKTAAEVVAWNSQSCSIPDPAPWKWA